jgi:hypothetical protein
MEPSPESSLLMTLKILTMNDISNCLPPGTFKYASKQSHAKLEEAVQSLSLEQHDILHGVAQSKRCKTCVKTLDHPLLVVYDEDEFLETVSEECHWDCLTKFVEETGCKVMETFVCAVCAGQFFGHNICSVKISNLQKKEKLVLNTMHPA